LKPHSNITALPGRSQRMDAAMTLIQAVAILSARFHCGAEWTIAYNGIGPHAYGITS